MFSSQLHSGLLVIQQELSTPVKKYVSVNSIRSQATLFTSLKNGI